MNIYQNILKPAGPRPAHLCVGLLDMLIEVLHPWCLLTAYMALPSPNEWLPRWYSGKESTCQCRRHKRCRINPRVGKIPWCKKWQPTPAFLPGKSQGQRSLAGYSPWGHKRVQHDLVTKQQQSKWHMQRVSAIFKNENGIICWNDRISEVFFHLFYCDLVKIRLQWK